ncbi:MAG: hypothetical protein VB084_11160 [Syntrophomonadaceae bacterium]|nr:hypothetical protein [Syntrophomonadaceae bacterium]
MEQKLKNQIAWLESLENSAIFNGDFNSIKLKIIENRKYFQHERLIHLLVTLGVGIIMMLVFNLFVIKTDLLYGILFFILIILECAYIIHYFRLENGVQKLWELEQQFLWTKSS